MVALYLAQVGDAQHKADGIQDVGLAAAVQAGNCIEEGVKVRHNRSMCVRLEAVNNDFLAQRR